MAEKIMQGIKQISELIGQAVKKRVVCLYRVSTVGQVEKDDIPMQKQYCREFCRGQSGWEIVKEFSEKGVSGFKVSAKDRDDAPCDYFSKAFMQCETKAIELGNICNLSQLNENLQENCIPLSVKNMDASSYEEFLTERRKLMAFMMKRYYWSL